MMRELAQLDGGHSPRLALLQHARQFVNDALFDRGGERVVDHLVQGFFPRFIHFKFNRGPHTDIPYARSDNELTPHYTLETTI
jgi:hypothetical protein